MVVPFWEAPLLSPGFVVVQLTSLLWLLMVEVSVGPKWSSSLICSLLGGRWGGVSVPDTFVYCLGCVFVSVSRL